MAIDHGLQGGNSERSRRKREQRAKKTKAIARGVLTKNKEVFFDEKSRSEYLTGFHSRKQERRKYGVAMQIIKDKKTTKEKAKERRQAMKEASQSKLTEGKLQDTTADDDGDKSEDEDDEIESVKDNGALVFDNSETQNMFGASVSVVVDDSDITQQLDDFKNPDMSSTTEFRKPTMNRKEVQALQLKKAMKLAKSLIHTRKATKRKMDRNRDKVRPKKADDAAATGGKKSAKGGAKKFNKKR